VFWMITLISLKTKVGGRVQKSFFEVSEKDGRSEVRFTQVGLVPDHECFDRCPNAWGPYRTTSSDAGRVRRLSEC
jgi:hypothetical protein